MSLFKTTDEQFVEISGIVTTMHAAGLPAAFLHRVAELAGHDQGIFELLLLWRTAHDCGDAEELDAVVVDLQEHLDDAEEAPASPQQKPYVEFDKLPDLVQQVVAHKKKLRDLIDKNGGVSAVAKKSGIPQPSLSRLLASASMPRKTTLYKLAIAMGLAETEVLAEWTR